MFKWLYGVRVSAGVEVKHMPVSKAASGDNTLIGAVAGKKITVLGGLLVAKEPVDVTIYSGPSATGTALTGPMTMAVDGEGFVLSKCASPELGDWQTVAGEALIMKLSAAKQISGWLKYCETD